MISKRERYQYRKDRTRKNLQANAFTRPRLSVYRSDKHLYAQVVDDKTGRTLIFASDLEPSLKEELKAGK